MERQVPYALSHLNYKRIPSHEVMVGHVGIGGSNPIRIQSMTTTDTMDTMATVVQSLKMVEAGCEIVRITAPSKKEAHNLAEIKKELKARGCNVPLVADIHFTPNAAEIAARIVEKVRVNPGNYADKKKFAEIEYTDASYQAELERIYERFSPLVKICKEEGTSMRVGTNHGSLSDRIMSRYGDTPLGMVESAMEFIRICEDFNYYDMVVSMKASNPQVMVQAYRMLMEDMIKRGRIYPLHLGVTEAGEGEDGRIKSALGIGTLLMDGIGDTVRVSLTEEPEHEMPVGQFLVDHFVTQANKMRSQEAAHPQEKITLPFDPFSFQRRESKEIQNVGGEQVPRVVADMRHNWEEAKSMSEIGYTYIPLLDKYNFSDIAADFVYLGKNTPEYELPGGLKRVYDAEKWAEMKDDELNFPLFESVSDFLNATHKSTYLNFVPVNIHSVHELIAHKDAFSNSVLLLDSESLIPTYDWRTIVYELMGAGIKQPSLIRMSLPESFDYYSNDPYPDYVKISEEAMTQLALSSNGSTLLVDGLVEGIWLTKADKVRVRTAFGMLQLARLRITKTEYISCPSCGRTLFDLQETTARIRKRTEHLKGVKIGIMGCIVNGPGEMADADYGYVGVGVGKISLYRGKEVIKKGVPTVNAVDELIELIREDGKWIEPNAEVVGA
ncbi:MAG: (E)-4-hydroxy-3-methylbut-2-enyl-diphosphate synthase [Bacteroidia bacterium]|nr:(E)-4-hydroxy-3-methylbut-2-enyl-diphosphate synthase [Bacteroidia bacterium]